MWCLQQSCLANRQTCSGVLGYTDKSQDSLELRVSDVVGFSVAAFFFKFIAESVTFLKSVNIWQRSSALFDIF